MPDDATTSGPIPNPLEPVLLQALLQHLPDAIYFKDRASRFLRVNLAMARRMGRTTPADLVGRTDFDFFTAEHAQPAFADEQRILATGQPLINAVEKETWSDGRTTWVSTTKVPLRDLAGAVIGTFGISRDVTAQKVAEDQLRQLSRAVDQCPVAILITDATGRIEYANPWFEHSSGYRLDEVRGRTPRFLKSGEHPPEFYAQLWTTILAGEEWSGELHNRRKDGSLYWERTTISAVRDESGAIANFIAVKEDTTEQRRALAEKQALETELALAHKLESIGRLSAGVAHELNTPAQFVADNLRFLADSTAQLGRYLAAVEELRRAAATIPALAGAAAELEAVAAQTDLAFLQQEIPRCVGQSLEGLARVGRTLGALQDFSRPGGAVPAPADLARLVETVLTISRHEWQPLAEVVTEFDPGQPPVPVVADEFNQALLNLLINAAQAIAAAPAPRAAPGRIRVRTATTAEHAVVEIADNGPGLPPEIRAHLFEPFVTTRGAAVASGQGLHQVHRIVTRLGGRVEYDTSPGGGTTFRLLLPLRPRT